MLSMIRTPLSEDAALRRLAIDSSTTAAMKPAR